MKIETNNKPITKQIIKSFENKINFSLSNEYTKFLLEYNGGEPELYIFNDKKLKTIVLNSLYGLKSEEEYDNLEKVYDTYNDRIMYQFIAIGDDSGGNQFCLGLSGVFKGKIYFWNHNTELDNDEFLEDKLPKNMYALTESFDEFLDKLEADKEV